MGECRGFAEDLEGREKFSGIKGTGEDEDGDFMFYTDRRSLLSQLCLIHLSGAENKAWVLGGIYTFKQEEEGSRGAWGRGKENLEQLECAKNKLEEAAE